METGGHYRRQRRKEKRAEGRDNPRLNSRPPSAERELHVSETPSSLCHSLYETALVLGLGKPIHLG